MSTISKISNIPINDISKIYEINKSNIAEINGMSLTASKARSIDIDNTKIDSDLTDFPLLVNLSTSAGTNNYDASDIFDAVGSDYNKLKIYDSDGTQLYTEVENWDATNNSAQLWVKVPTISSSTSTRLTLDYSTISGSNDYISDDPTAKAINLSVDENNVSNYDPNSVNDPCVIKESDTSYKMWYSGSGSGPHWRIMYCTSTDGINWSNHQMVIDVGSTGSYDSHHAYKPSVIKDGNTYKMWYAGDDATYNRIIYCTSTDGINWSNHQMVIDKGSAPSNYDVHAAYAPCVIKDGSTYKMWYSGSDGTHMRIIYATSTNGTSWSNFQLAVNYNNISYDNANVSKPIVIKENSSSYKMWYTGNYNRIIYATSTNGTSWSNFQLSVDIGSEGTYDSAHSENPYVIKEDSNLYKMWYVGHSGHKKILYTTSEDGKIWTKNVVNRVWEDDFSAVYHMSQDPTGGAGCIYDSTLNANHGTPNGSMTNSDLVDGKISKAIEFDGQDDYIAIPSNQSISTRGAGTTSFWLYRNDDGGVDGYIYQKNGQPIIYTGGAGTDLQVFWSSAHGLLVDGSYSDQYDNLGTGSWHYITLSWNNSNTLSIYIDGEVWKTYTGLSLPTSTDAYEFGRYYNTNYFNGVLDEIHMSKIARSADWIKATYYSNWDNLNYWS